MSSSKSSLSLPDRKTAIVRVRRKEKEADDTFEYGSFTWSIEDFSKLKDDRHYSHTFNIAGLNWRILIKPNEFSMYLGMADASNLPFGWSRCANFSLTLVNQLDTSKSIEKPRNGTVRLEFKKEASEWGFTSIISCSELYDSSAGYLLNDTCVIEAKVDIPIKNNDQGPEFSATVESSIKKEPIGWELSDVNSEQAPDSIAAPNTPDAELVPTVQDTPGSCIVKPTVDCPADPSPVKVIKEVPTTPLGERMDFKGFGHIDKAFVPLLEEVCSLHPSLIICQLKSSKMFAKSAFKALGRLLHFLKTTKVKDMAEESCERLQLLWEEVEAFRFDLSWLEPTVQYAFDMKRFVQRGERMKRLREDVDVLENEIKRRMRDVDAMESEVQMRKGVIAVAEVDLQVTKRDLAKMEEDFNGIDMDSELGFGPKDKKMA